MVMPRFLAALASVACLILVVPDVETIVLPLRSSILLMLADFLVTYLLAVMKCVLV